MSLDIRSLFRGDYPRDAKAKSESDASLTKLNRKNNDENNFLKGSQQIYGKYNDPTYLGFKLMFDWDNSELFKGGITTNPAAAGMLVSAYPKNSALGYLKSIGETVRVRYLSNFIKQLHYINQNMPWYFQTITGLDEMWASYTNWQSNYYGGEGARITLGTLESVDLKISGMIELIRSALHDPAYSRIVIPSNLRSFIVRIYIQEIRNFHSKQDYPGIDKRVSISTPTQSTIASENLTNSSFWLITLGKCKFLPNASNAAFASVTNTGNEVVGQQITFSYKDIKIQSEIPWFDYKIDDHPMGREKEKDGRGQDTSKTNKYSYGELDNGMRLKEPNRLERAAGTYMNRIIDGAVNDITNLAEDAAMRLVRSNLGLDNVYGKGFTILNALRGSTNVNQYIRPAITKLENIYPDSALLINNIPDKIDNLFPDGKTNEPNEIGDENIFGIESNIRNQDTINQENILVDRLSGPENINIESGLGSISSGTIRVVPELGDENIFGKEI